MPDNSEESTLAFVETPKGQRKKPNHALFAKLSSTPLYRAVN